jgi:nucleotide-binding universal stress UspA family protein
MGAEWICPERTGSADARGAGDRAGVETEERIMSEQVESGDAGRAELGSETRGRIVVGIDGSPESKVALQWAGVMADRTGALIDAVTVWSYPAFVGIDAAGVYDVDWAGDAEKALVAVVDSVFGPDRPAGLRTFTLQGDAAHRLIEHAADAQLLIVGNRGRGGFRGLLLGSVSTKIAAHACCPVLIVHAGDEPPAEER